MFKSLFDLAEQQHSGARLSREDALAILNTPDEEILDLVAAAGRLRTAAFGKTVKVNYLVNLKSGLCPEDCFYCSQRLGSAAQILKYTWLKPDETAAQASAGIHAGASRVCLVASGRGPTDRDVDRVATIVQEVKDEHPAVEVCVCLGILKQGQAARLHAAGVDAYNHNLNTSEERYGDICTTHTFDDRVNTVKHAQDAGLSSCSGLIVGMGESDDELIDAIFALRDLGADSIPINFLMPFEGTPMEGTHLLNPLRCIRILALARFACWDAEVRMAGGREMHLRSLQPLALWLANSLFLGDYLTSEGQDASVDVDMITDAGFTVLGAGDLPAASPDQVALRQRGAGTTAAPNA